MNKIIIVAYDLNPKIGSESGVASIWLKIISKNYFVDVFTREVHRKDIESESWDNIRFHYINIKSIQWIRRLLHKIGAYNILSHKFINAVKEKVANLSRDDYHLLHCLSPFGLFSYNDLYKLGFPVLIGPILGNLPTPPGFKHIVNDGILRYLNFRVVAYRCIMKMQGWKNYFLHARKIIIANEGAKSFLPTDVSDRCVVIYDSVVNIDFFKPGIRIKQNNDIVTVLFAGRLIGLKGITLLIEACRICVKKGCDSFKVVIAGNGPLKKTIEKLIIEYSLQGHVRFLGRLDKSGMLEQYQNSDIFCLPTLRDNGGNAILEAMACGLPVITSNYGGPAYITTDEAAIKINLSDCNSYIRDLANALTYLINNETVRITMGEKGRDWVKENFSQYSLKQQINKLYAEIVD